MEKHLKKNLGGEVIEKVFGKNSGCTKKFSSERILESLQKNLLELQFSKKKKRLENFFFCREMHRTPPGENSDNISGGNFREIIRHEENFAK